MNSIKAIAIIGNGLLLFGIALMGAGVLPAPDDFYEDHSAYVLVCIFLSLNIVALVAK